MRRSLQAKTGTTSIVMLVVLMAGAVIAFIQARAEVSAIDWVGHTYITISELQRVSSLSKDVSRGERGYVITGDDKFLKPYQDATEKLQQSVETLISMVADNPPQAQRAAFLQKKVTEQLRVAWEVIQARKEQGFDTAGSLIAAGSEEKTISEIRQTVTTMKEEETDLLRQRSAELERTTTNTLLAFFVLFFIAGVLVFSLISMVNKYTRAQAGREESEHLFRQLAENIREVFWVSKPDGLLLYLSPTYQEVWGRSIDTADWERDVFLACVEPDDKAKVEEHLAQRFSRPAEALSIEFRIRRQDGLLKWIHARSFPILERGQVVRRVGIAQDISDRKEAEKRVSEFYSTVSHELRSPLSSIRGSLGLMAGGLVGPLSAEAQEFVNVGIEECDRLVRLINDILDMRKIEAGRLEIRLGPNNANELLKAAITATAGLSKDSKVTVVQEGSVDEDLNCDRDRIIQVLTNLLSNAIKFSKPSGSVVALASKNERAVRYEIIDKGPGIAKQDIEKLFRPFQQLNMEQGEHKGTGLGLVICKGIMEQHEGTIGVISEKGKGSTFWIEIPLGGEKKETDQPDSQASKRPDPSLA